VQARLAFDGWAACLRRALLIGLGGLSACAQDDVVAVRRCTGAGCAVTDPAFCQAMGPQISAAQDSTLCGGPLIARLLPLALCTCAEARGGDLLSDSFDSSVAPYAPGGTQGDVGMQGSVWSEGSWDIAGSLLAGAASGVQVQTSLRTQGSLWVQGPLVGATVTTLGDASVGGNIQLVNLRVDGTLTTPASSTVVVSGQRQVAASAQQAVTVPSPCPCNLDPYVTAPINDVQSRNDNAARGLLPEQFERFSGDVALDLPCGRYYFSRVAGTGSLRLRILGRVELAIGGGIDIQGGWSISLLPGAELDLYVHGDVAATGAVALGEPQAPTRFRWFPGGIDALRFSGGGYISAAVLGRRRALMSSTPLDLYGGMVVDSLQVNAGLRVHRDLAIGRLAGRCREP
jgi:hypothetical protein